MMKRISCSEPEARITILSTSESRKTPLYEPSTAFKSNCLPWRFFILDTFHHDACEMLQCKMSMELGQFLLCGGCEGLRGMYRCWTLVCPSNKAKCIRMSLPDPCKRLLWHNQTLEIVRSPDICASRWQSSMFLNRTLVLHLPGWLGWTVPSASDIGLRGCTWVSLQQLNSAEIDQRSVYGEEQRSERERFFEVFWRWE